MIYRLVIKCIECGAEHTMLFQSDKFDREYVERFSGLLDGKTGIFAQPLPESSPIGRCVVCRGRMESTIFEGKSTLP